MRAYVPVFLTISAFATAVSACGGQDKPAETPASAGLPPPAPTPPPGPPVETTTTQGLGPAGATGTKLPPAGGTAGQGAGGQGGGAPGAGQGGGSGEPGRTTTDIANAIKGRRDEFRACYDKAAERHPGIEGDLDVRFVIDPSGVVTDATVDKAKSTLVEPEVDKCVLSLVKTLKFAESQKGMETRAHYPFNFNPRSGGKTPTPPKK